MEFEWARESGDDALPCVLELFAQIAYRHTIDDFLDVPTLARDDGVMAVLINGVASALVALEDRLILWNVLATHAYTTVRCM